MSIDLFPELYGPIAIDTETRDPGIFETGPGWYREDGGHVAGISVATDTFAGYYPIAHSIGNMDKDTVVRWLQDQINKAEVIIFHNAQYDLGWLARTGITVNKDIEDTMIMSPLLNEHRKSHALNELGKEYGLGVKDTQELYAYGASMFGLKKAKAVMANIWRFSSSIVAPYAIQDAKLTLALWNKMKQEIKDQKLEKVYNLERKLLPYLVKMRMQGVRVDLNKAEQTNELLLKKEIELKLRLKNLAGMEVNVNAPRSVEMAFKKLGIAYNSTSKGNPSFTREFLEHHPHEIASLIIDIRKVTKYRTEFVESNILEGNYKGRIHCQFNPLKSDRYGTVSGRFSCSQPNLQQIPSRDKVYAPYIRDLFIPEDGCQWLTADYSQQEPRLTAHYAILLNLSEAEKVRQQYIEKPDSDYHQMVADMAHINRTRAKTINLGLAYGMGKDKLSRSLDLTSEDAEELFEQYHSKVPFIKELSDICSRKANRAGFIKTILGRRCRFPYFEPVAYNCRVEKGLMESEAKAAQTNLTMKQWYRKNLKRCKVYMALNRLIQGSAADMTKQAMADVIEAGYLPHLQVHDELDLSVNSDKEAKEIKEIMEKAVQLTVPVLCDCALGNSWAEAKWKGTAID